MKIWIIRRCLFLSALVLFLSIFLFPNNVFADDDNCLDGALFITDTLYIPKMVVEVTDQLYSACFQVKQVENEVFLELTSLKLSDCQETSTLTATLSIDGKLHIPYLDIQGASFWTIDLQWVVSTSLLPIRFALLHYQQYADENLGFHRINPTLGRTIDYWKCVDPEYAKYHCPNK